jgi:amino acid adenylation domain-containing protein/FkbM family methyltransferase
MIQERETAAQGFRLSPQQRRMWAERQRHGGGWQKTMVAVTVDGDIDTAALKSAVDDLVARYEILRTRLLAPAGSRQPLQVIGEPSVDWADGGEQGGEEVETAMARTWCLPVDPVHGPLLRASHCLLAPRRHLVTLTLPATAGDAASALNLVREIARACAGRRRDAAEGEALQYADLAEWKNELLEADEMQAGRLYWENTRWAALPAASVPFAQRQEASSFTPEMVPVIVDAATARWLHESAAAGGASLRALLLTFWQILLARLGGINEFAIGVGYDGRRYDDLTDAIGPFACTLPFLCRLDLALPLDALLSAVAEREADLARWQEGFPVETAVDAEFSEFRFTYSAVSPGELLAEGFPAFRLARLRSYAERFSLALEASGGAAALALELHYDAALFSRESIALIAARLARLLQSVGADPSLPIGRWEIIADEERATLFHQLSPPPGPLPEARCFHELFAERAAQDPSRLALVAGDRQLSYGALDAEANRLARHLIALGASPEAPVAILLERSLELVVALLAVLKTGAAFVPLDPAFPRQRMEHMLLDSGSRLMVSTSALASDAAPAGVRLVALDAEAPTVAEQPDASLGVRVDPASVAYVIFTSGSTGWPKGVAVEHRQLVHYVRSILARLELPAGSSFATVSSFAADLGYTAVFPALASGGCLHVIAADQAADPLRLAAIFRTRPVDVLKITPSHLSALLAATPSRDFLPRQRLILGGEVARWELIERIAALAPDCTVLNHYGPTESTVGVCTHRVEARAAAGVAGTVPIGRPLAHTRMILLDRDGLPVPLGVSGELYLGGAGVSRGYVGDPALTAERFVPDPHADEPGARLYRTGDRGRWLLSGDLEFLGRVDGQIKIRGFRVEPGEVENVLERHPAVAAAVVAGREAASGELSLAAYVAVDTERAGPLQRLLRLRSEGRLDDRDLLELPNGMAVAHLNEGETRFSFREIFEERIYLRNGIHLPPGACVIDAGASIGLFSLMAARLVPGARILAFEPVPAVFRALRLNAEIYGGISAFEFGLSYENRRAEATYYPHLTLISSLYADQAEEREVVRSFLLEEQRGSGEAVTEGALLEELLTERLAGESVTVALRRLSDVLREHGIDRVDLLKIDVQKSELDVLAGIDEEDWPKIGQIVAEVHDLAGRLAQITALLESKGYEVTVEQERALASTSLYDVYARRAGVEEPAAEREMEPTSALASPAALLDDLGRHLRESLPEHMVPSTLTLLAALPLTPNGKLDRGALPDPEAVAFRGQRNYQQPETETERKLAEIWSAVLGSRPFGVRDSFFEIGGHSLLAARVIARIRNVFQVEVTLRDFFNQPTIAGLARRIEVAEPVAASAEERIDRLVRAAYRQGRAPVD